MASELLADEDSIHEDDTLDKVAVIAVLGEENNSLVTSAASAIDQSLASMEKIKTMDVAEVMENLRSDRIDECSTEIDRLEGIYQQGYLQAYSFKYFKAIGILNRVLDGLDSHVASKRRWALWAKTLIMKGVALCGLKKESAAIRTFILVLKTRPEMVLSKKNYSPKTIDLWTKAKGILRKAPKGKLVIESSPAEATVELDGKRMGKTPLILEVPVGRYHLHIQHPKAGGISRMVTASAITSRIRVQLNFEGAVDLCHGFPVIASKTPSAVLESRWWPWLAAKLHIRRLVAVQIRTTTKKPRLVAALVDLERAVVIREGWFEVDRGSKDTLKQDSVDLARFLVTGQAADRMKTRFQVAEELHASTAMSQDLHALEPDFEIRPWYRTWWTFAIGSGAILLAAVSSHLVSDYYSRQGHLSSNANARADSLENSETWFGVAMGGYGLGAALLATGLILHISFDENPKDQAKNGMSLGSAISPMGACITLTKRF